MILGRPARQCDAVGTRESRGRSLPRGWFRGIAKPGLAAALLYLAVGVGIALADISHSGPLWPDSPRYLNAAAMIHDWFRSGPWDEPIEFAEENYAHLPGFSVPYHPPGYPAALAGWFLLTGVSYVSARVFIALCWSASGWLFYRIQRELGFGPGPAVASGLLLLTTPQLALWSRDAMSEAPSLVPLFAAALFWLRWLRTGRAVDGLAAAALAELAFFFRVTTAGVLPGLIAFGAATGVWDRRRVAWIVGAGIAYLSANATWVAFAAQYSAYEVAADGKGTLWASRALEYFRVCWPGIGASGSAALASIGLVKCRTEGGSRRAAGFWLAWLASYAAFKIAVPTSVEVRHFFTAIPAFAGLAAAALTAGCPGKRTLSAMLAAGGIAVNLAMLHADCPRGIAGYEAVGAALARCPEPGNVLLACWEDQDLIFRYRSDNPACERYLLRSDRTLVVRVADYAHVPPVVNGCTENDVVNLVRAGRIKYLATCAPAAGARDARPAEMQLVDRAVRGHPELFELLDSFPVEANYVNGIHPGSRGAVCLWKYRDVVAGGPPDFPILIPTAGLEIRPKR